MPKEALILFTRMPLPGRTKTRLMPWLDPDQCAALHRAMLTDIGDTLRRAGKEVFVFYTPGGDPAALRRLCGDAVYLTQQGADLGEKMDQATREIFSRGFDSCLLMGSDIPAVTEDDLRAASDVLLTHDVVLAPTEDGGYWLIGLKQPCSQIFAHQPYGSLNVLEAAQSVCRKIGVSLALGPRLRDIDQMEDLFYHAAHPGKRMPRSQKLIDEFLSKMSMQPPERS
jgi:rSAM/selenodomain-associated transferase 1